MSVVNEVHNMPTSLRFEITNTCIQGHVHNCLEACSVLLYLLIARHLDLHFMTFIVATCHLDFTLSAKILILPPKITHLPSLVGKDY